MKHLFYVIALLGIFFQARALDEALKPIKQAVVRADLSYVTNGLKHYGPLKPEDKKELLALAQKWAKYRATVLTPLDKAKIYGGMVAILAAIAPFILYKSSLLLQASVRSREAFMIVFGALGAYELLIGISAIYSGWNAGGT